MPLDTHIDAVVTLFRERISGDFLVLDLEKLVILATPREKYAKLSLQKLGLSRRTASCIDSPICCLTKMS